jgi:pimeloyl-ACP methyl ester carboxylesterase
LLVHGIIGDNENKVNWIFNHSTLYEDFTILAFDYENLDTPIQATAGRLHKMLSDCQLPPQSVTIVAHSMGGLVSRWMIEHVDGGSIAVKCLIQVGTPNGGSEISDFRHKLLGWISLGLNGVDAFKPWLSPCGFLLKGVAGKLFHTLDEMQPGSPFLKKLNAQGKQTPGIPYYLLAGDTSEIEAAFDTTDPAWKKLVTCLQERGKYIFADYLFFSDRPNDMAVRVESMHELPWGRHDQSDTIPCDHLHYFDNANGRRVVESWLRG